MKNYLTYSEALKLRLSLIITHDGLTFLSNVAEFNTKLYKHWGRFYPVEDVQRCLSELEEEAIISNSLNEFDRIEYPEDYDFN